MAICVKDITNDLGVMPITVWRWIRDGKLKGTIANRRAGWEIEEEEYRRFLNANPKWRLVHDGDVYTKNEIKAKGDALLQIIAQLLAMKMTVLTENHDESYMEGFDRAITDITAAINKEMRKKVPNYIDSRPEQSA